MAVFQDKDLKKIMKNKLIFKIHVSTQMETL